MTAPYAPVWLGPSAPGQMSNKRGSTSGGGDDLLLKVRYSNPNGSDAVETVRFLASKIPASGGPSSLVLDTWHMGVGSFPAYNPNGGVAFDVRTNSVFVYDAGSGPRLYAVAFGSGVGATRSTVYSASINGPSLGAWRAETQPYPLGNHSVTVTYSSIVQAGGYIYLASNGATGVVSYAAILGDGTFGPWKVLTAANPLVSASNTNLFSYADPSGSYLVAFSQLTTATRGAKVNTDGTLLNGTWITGGAQAAARGYCGVFFDPSGLNDGNGTLWFIGGFDGAAATLTIESAPLTLGNGTIGAWALAGTGLPAARCDATFVQVGDQLLVVGGSSTLPTPVVPGTTTVYRITSSALGGAWTTDATALGTAILGGGAASVSASESGSVRTADQGLPTIFSFYSGATLTTRLKINTNTRAVAAQLQTAAASVGAELIAGNLGAGGVVTNNQDGTVDVTYAWGAVAALGQATGLVDGDVVTVSAQFMDVNGGDLSPVTLTVFKVGQPPTLASVLPGAAPTTGRPVASFLYVPGAGGGPEYSWRITVKIGATTFFDTGLRHDLANLVLVDPRPLLLSATAYTFTWTATSTDDVFNGATNTVTSTLAVTPAIAAVPAAPTTLAAAPDHANGLFNLTWVNPTPPGTPGARVYWRLNGSLTWLPLKHNVGALAAFAAMDLIPLILGVDFAVSQLNLAVGTEGESVLSNVVSNVKIQPPPVQWGGTGYTAMIHVAGNGSAQHAGLLLNVDVGLPSFDRTVEAVFNLLFGAPAPTVRFGPGNYRQIKVPHVMRDTTAPVDAIVDAARAGATLYFRDKTGVVIPCAPAATRNRTNEVWASGHFYYAEELDLTEVGFVFAP